MLHKYVWYSICSAHQQIDDQCELCHNGQWIDTADPAFISDQELYRKNPDLWIDKHNPCACITCSGYCSCNIDGHHMWEKSNG